MDAHSPLGCGCGPLTAQSDADDDGPVDRRDAATSNVTDLRRARARARSAIRDLQDLIIDYVERQNVRRMVTAQNGERRLNQALTQVATDTLRARLVNWLVERQRITMGRAARAAFDAIAGVTPADFTRDQIRGESQFSPADRALQQVIRNTDVGLLLDDDGGLATRLGDRLTRQLRAGVAQDETVPELARRVELILTDGSADDRKERGVTGQTTSSKAQMIAHDSIQDAYNATARDRYLRNGFRFAVYDATVDFKTTNLCRRMDEHVIDMLETPFLIPPLHPHCRSGIRPILDTEGRTPLSKDDIADDFLQTILSTKSYRPPVVGPSTFQPTPLSQQFGQA